MRLKTCSGEFLQLIDQLFILPADDVVTFSSEALAILNIGKTNEFVYIKCLRKNV